MKQWEQLGNMHNWKFRNFLNKNPPNALIKFTFIHCHEKVRGGKLNWKLVEKKFALVHLKKVFSLLCIIYAESLD